MRKLEQQGWKKKSLIAQRFTKIEQNINTVLLKIIKNRPENILKI